MNFVGDIIASFNATKKYEKQIEQIDNRFAKKFDELYSEQLYKKIRIGIWNLCIDGMSAYMDALEEHDMFKYPDINKKKADVIYNNTMKFGQGDIVVKNMVDCIRLYPYEKNYYIFLYKNPFLEEEAIATIEEMAEFFCLGDEFWDEIELIRNERNEAKCTEIIEDCVEATIFEKADAVKQLLAMGAYGCENYKTEVRERIVRFVNDTVKEIKEEVLGACDYSLLDDCIDRYCDRQVTWLQKDKDNLLIAIKCAEIMQKYPFFATLCKDDFNLSLNGNYMDCLESIEKLCDLMEKIVVEVAPKAIKDMLWMDIYTQWDNNVDSLENLERFEMINKQFYRMFLIEAISENTLENRKKKIIECEPILEKLKCKYDNILKESNSIDISIFKNFMNDIIESGLDEFPSKIIIDYKVKIVNSITQNCELKSATELFELYKLLMVYRDDYFDERAQQIREIFLKKVKADNSVVKTQVDGRDYGFLIIANLSDKIINHTNSQIHKKVEQLFKKVRGWKEYFNYTQSHENFEDCVDLCMITCKNINIQMDSKEVYAVCLGKLIKMYVTRKGIVFCQEKGGDYIIEYSELKGMVCVNNGALYLIKKENNERIWLGRVHGIDKAQELIDFMCQFLVYLYELPNVIFDEMEFEKQIDEVSNLTRNIDKKTIDQLDSIKKKLMSYPKYIREPEVEKLQLCYEQKQANLRGEFDTLVNEYWLKTETELEELLLEIKSRNYPKAITGEILPQIEETLKEAIKIRCYDEMKMLTENYQNKSVEELEKILKELKKYENELADNMSLQIKKTLEEKRSNQLNEIIMSVGGDINDASYANMINIYECIANASNLDKAIKERCLSELKQKISKIVDEIVTVLQNEMKRKYANTEFIKNHIHYFNGMKFSNPESFYGNIYKSYSESELYQWYERPIAMYKTIIITTHNVIDLSTRLNEQTRIPVGLNTKFYLKKKFLSVELYLGDKYLGDCPFSIDNCDILVEYLNKILNKVRQCNLKPKKVKQTDTQPVLGQPTLVETLEKNEFPLANMKVQRSVAEMNRFVNQLPVEIRQYFIGNEHPKFAKKVKNAKKSHAYEFSESEVFALYDSTNNEKGKEGMVMTSNRVLVKESSSSKVLYSDIKKIQIFYDDRYSKCQFVTKYGRVYLNYAVPKETNLIIANGFNAIVRQLYGLKVKPYEIEIVKIKENERLYDLL